MELGWCLNRINKWRMRTKLIITLVAFSFLSRSSYVFLYEFSYKLTENLLTYHVILLDPNHFNRRCSRLREWPWKENRFLLIFYRTAVSGHWSDCYRNREICQRDGIETDRRWRSVFPGQRFQWTCNNRVCSEINVRYMREK